ncbi:MAG: hypothetical protein VYD64_09140, partial [Pseudomonadota bacterium]|nr:hypothetical protein [Pseudomonadota bacterium]
MTPRKSPFGKTRARRNPYYQGPVSDHFDGITFFNPGGVEPGNIRDLARWQLANGRAKWPKHWPSPFHGVRPEPRVGGDRLS